VVGLVLPHWRSDSAVGLCLTVLSGDDLRLVEGCLGRKGEGRLRPPERLLLGTGGELGLGGVGAGTQLRAVVVLVQGLQVRRGVLQALVLVLREREPTVQTRFGGVGRVVQGLG